MQVMKFIFQFADSYTGLHKTSPLLVKTRRKNARNEESWKSADVVHDAATEKQGILSQGREY
jgi:hypothetical protein